MFLKTHFKICELEQFKKREYGEDMDKDLLIKQMVNEVEGNFLSLAYTYDLSSIEQLELLDKIEEALRLRWEDIRYEVKGENILHCEECGKYYEKKD
ncbi:MAG: hypothetical protein LIO71_03240 [Ruminococcus sp.]|nr:hypothetical protein [Ruminococcus sp.]